MAELEALSKLKMAGKLHYWRGTVEIDEHELHAICDEIQAEYDKAVAAMSRAAGKWARADAELREHDGTRWYELFGTPERATQTMVTQNFACGVWGDCLRCPFGRGICPENLPLSEDAEQKMLEWLGGGSDGR